MTIPADVTALAGTGGVGGASTGSTTVAPRTGRTRGSARSTRDDGSPAADHPEHGRVLHRRHADPGPHPQPWYGGGVLPAVPALPGPGWFTSNGSDYSQVAFNRADYCATERRAADDTRLVGVGVGPGIGTLTGRYCHRSRTRAPHQSGCQPPASPTTRPAKSGRRSRTSSPGSRTIKWTPDVRGAELLRRTVAYRTRGNGARRPRSGSIGSNTSKAELRQQQPDRRAVRVPDQLQRLGELDQGPVPRRQHQSTDTDGWKRSNPSGQRGWP